MSRSSNSFARPNCAISAALSAPHSVAASAINKTSTRLWLALAARGSTNFLKILLNLPIRLPWRFGSRLQNPHSASVQHPAQTHQHLAQTHMRFPCSEMGTNFMPRLSPAADTEHG